MRTEVHKDQNIEVARQSIKNYLDDRAQFLVVDEEVIIVEPHQVNGFEMQISIKPSDDGVAQFSLDFWNTESPENRRSLSLEKALKDPRLFRQGNILERFLEPDSFSRHVDDVLDEQLAVA